jgi:hypothetical protein
MCYKPVNGWTKDAIIKQLRLKNNGSKSEVYESDGKLHCRYRGDNNNACSIGCFIPDDLYNTTMEGLGVSHLLERFPLADKMPLPLEALIRLQCVHDLRLGDVRENMIDWVLKNVD